MNHVGPRNAFAGSSGIAATQGILLFYSYQESVLNDLSAMIFQFLKYSNEFKKLILI
jgi:hypothetical protein